MLTLFPQILFLAPFSAVLLRTAVAATLAYTAWKHSAVRDTVKRVLSAVEILAGALILVGAWTQVAAIVGVCIVLIWLAFPSTRVVPLSTALLILVMTASLVITGAGLLAFDLPL